MGGTINLKTASALTLLLVAMVCNVAAGEVIYVDDDESADFNNIQAAINDSNDGDTIIVSDGTYTGDGNRDIDFLGKAITLRSENGPENCIIDCNGTEAEPYRGFYFHNGEDSSSVLNGFTIINGYKENGGGIRCTGSSPHITNCVITHNVAPWDPGTPGPFATYGGGISCDSSPTISYCVITNNSSPNNGRGGGIYCISGSAMISHCTITRNSADFCGGGIFCEADASPRIFFSVLTDNYGDDFGGGIGGQSGCTPTVSHCIVWGNRARRGGPEIYCGGSVVSYSDVKGGYGGEGNIDADPCFVDPGSDDYHLLPHSLCINAGDPCYSTMPGETDIDGEPRVIDGRIDIGPDEANYGVPLIRISPAELEFHAPKDGSNPETQILSIYNVGSGILKWEVIEDCTWLEVDPNSGETVGEIDEVILSVNISGLDTGQYSCELMISDPCAGNNPHTFLVSLYIYDGGELYVPSEYGTIQEGIDWAFDGATVIVADGIYTGAGNRNINFKGKAITVLSENGPQNCIIDCEQAYNTRGFIFNNGEDANSVLSGFTIKRGKVFSPGGGIHCNGSSPKIEDCIIINNITKDSGNGKSYGGGIYCGSNSNPTIVSCIIRNNVASGSNGVDFGIDGESGYGGGILCSSDSHATIENCVVAGNMAVGGNGFMMMDPVWGGDGYGGGIYGNVTIHNTAIIGNTTLGGDGNYGGNGYGGGIYASSATINNSTISDNTATGGQGYPIGEGYSYGGGIYIEGGTTLTNCILWANASSFGPEIYGIGSVSYSDVQGGHGGVGNINVDPGFADTDGRLSIGSPCIDAGDNNSVPTDTYDLDGDGDCNEPIPLDLNRFPRLIDDLCTVDTGNEGTLGPPVVDMGAYEFLAADIVGNGHIDLGDFALLADKWSLIGCGICGGADLTCDGNIDWHDLRELTIYWLVGE